ncbi:MAG: dihydrodipicolinate synthase family protein [Desulfobacterales bacterium]|nr:dihydrodipicolinate synthase family protein [Desulfobacterales bacterium]
MTDLSLNGAFPPILTSFEENGDIAHDKMAANIEKWNAFPLKGMVIFGSNGEYPYLTSEEKLEVMETVAQNARKDMVLIAGTGCESTRETIDMTNKAAKKGAHAALLLTPNYYTGAMNHGALVQHFTAVADASDIPVLIYNVPKYTGINTSVALVSELSRHPNIIGLKDSTGNVAQLAEVIDQVPSDFQTLVGTAGALMGALSLGCVGGILALANIAPAQCLRLIELVKKGDMDSAAVLQRRLAPVNTAITATYGVAGLKAAMDMLGYYGGAPRLPMQPATDEVKAKIKDILVTAKLLEG